MGLSFKKLVAEMDESGDKDKMAMFADALPKQQKMLMKDWVPRSTFL